MNEQKENPHQTREFLLRWAPIVLSAAAGICSVVVFFLYGSTHKELTNIGLRIENELRPREFENNLKLTLYKEVKEAVGHKDTSLHKVTLLVVNEMLEHDSVFREKLINILLQSATSPQSLLATQQRLDEFNASDTLPSTERITVDVFYLEDSESRSKPRAEAVRTLLQTRYPDYTVRVRLLPTSINVRSGYRIDRNQIRHDAHEQQLATDILNTLKEGRILQHEPVLKRVKNNTYNYISVFVKDN